MVDPGSWLTEVYRGRYLYLTGVFNRTDVPFESDLRTNGNEVGESDSVTSPIEATITETQGVSL